MAGVRLREQATGKPVPEPRRPMTGAPADEPAADYLAEVFQQIFLARQRTPQPLQQRPLIVLAAGRRPAPPPGISEAQWETVRGERDRQLEDLVGLSANALFIRGSASGHNMHRDNPALVAKAIRDVRDAAVHGTGLANRVRVGTDVRGRRLQ